MHDPQDPQPGSANGDGNNPFAAPHARLAQDAPADETPIFFAVGEFKFAVMSTVTLGFYLYYWFYRNWRLVQFHEIGPQRPNAILRTIFFVIMAWSMFERMRVYAQEKRIAVSIQPALLAIALIVIQIAAQLPGPGWMLGLLAPFPILFAQRAANLINAAQTPKSDPNTRFTGANFADIAIGGLILVLAVMGTLMGPIEPGTNPASAP